MAQVYGIFSPNSGRVYIGCTGNAAKRWREHRCLLRKGAHASASLQAEWQATDGAGFHLKVLETISVANPTAAEKRQREQHWMDHYAALGLLFNETRQAFQLSEEARQKGVAAAHRERGRRWDADVNEKRRQAQLGRPKGHGAKISATKRAKRNAQVMI